ncbi:hypothetical protein E4U53_000818 [Claviceps sorghi]|nr:hypothetical protein E4U53_000818 [Claviceps sorghi]
MSPASATDGARKPQAWTESAKLREGRAIDWSKINMPGRTPKSLQNTWFSLKKTWEESEKAEGVDVDNGGSGESPAKSTTPRKKLPSKKKAMPFQDAQDDDDDDDKKSPKKATGLKKRAAEGQGKKLKCATKHEPDDEDDQKVDLLEHFYDDT